MHVASEGGDRQQFLGEAVGGGFGWVREHRRAHENIVIGGIGRSGLRYDPTLFPVWDREQLLRRLTSAPVGV